MGQIPVALQLYTVRDVAADDFVGTVRKVAEMGYAGVEFAGTGGLEASELKALLDDLELRPAGSHVGIDVLEQNLTKVIEDNQTIGNHWIVCPYMPEERRADADGWRKTAETLTEIGSKVKKAGLQLCYHNHSFEFETFEGRTGFDIFYETADPDLVQAEIDTYWVKHGGEDPAETIRRFAGRCPLVHLKDMTAGPDPTFTEVGSGILDFEAIFAACAEAGVEWYIVEQGVCPGPSLASARISLETLRKWGIA